MATLLSSDLNSTSSIPYFLWDEPMTVAELKLKLTSMSDEERARLLGKILREARDTDVWHFTTPDEVVQLWEKIEPHLGRRQTEDPDLFTLDDEVARGFKLVNEVAREMGAEVESL